MSFINLHNAINSQKSSFTRWSNEVINGVDQNRASVISKNVTDKMKYIQTVYDKVITVDCTEHELTTVTELLDSLLDSGNTTLHNISQLSTNNVSKKVVNLPKLVIPQFSGNLLEFSQFWSLFETSIHKNDSITDSEKMSYLISLLKDEALQSIVGFPVSDANYAECIKILKARYGKTENLVKVHFDKMRHSQPLSSDSNSIKKFLNEFLVHFRTLESLGQKFEQQHVLLNQILLEKLTGHLRVVGNRVVNDSQRSGAEVSTDDLIMQLINELDNFSDSLVHISEEIDKINLVKITEDPAVKINKCKFCSYSHVKGKCFAFGKKCNICNQLNHFAKCCKNSNYSKPEEQKVTLNTISKINTLGKEIVITSDGKNINCLVDSGAAVSMLTEKTYREKFNHISLSETDIVLRNFDGSKIFIKGFISLPCTFKNFNGRLKFYITDSGRNILGFDQFDAIGIELKCNSISATEIFDKYSVPPLNKTVPNVEVNLSLKRNYQPSIRAPYKVPLSLQEPLKNKIDEYLKLGYIEPVDTKINYLSPVVIVKKTKGIRLCVDYKKLNENLNVEQYHIPYAEDIFVKLSKAKYFSTIDLKNGYHHLALSNNSKDLTSFCTMFGNFRFKVLPFGLNNAPSIFARLMDNVLKNIPGCCHFFDDIVVYGSNMEEHNDALQRVLFRLAENHLEINKEKCAIGQTTITYLGQQIGDGQMKPCSKNVEAVLSLTKPACARDLQTFLGMVNYHSRYIPNLSAICSPLRRLLQKGVDFEWNSACEAAFVQLKELLTSQPVVKIFNPRRQSILSSDASYQGIGGCLSQIDESGAEYTTSFVSMSLNASQKNYSATELELLGVVSVVLRLRHFLYGIHFTIRTDHEPLEKILTNKASHPSPVISRLLNKIQDFDYSVQYVKGRNNSVADCLSRLGGNTTPPENVINVVYEPVPEMTSISYDSWKTQSQTDSTIQEAITEMKNAIWTNKNNAFYKFRHNLSEHDGGLLYGPSGRLVMPRSLVKETLDIGHLGHRGQERMKNFLRRYVFWPGMTKEIEDFVKDCCGEAHKTLKPCNVPVQPIEPSERPWTFITADLAGPIQPYNKYLLIIVDKLTKWPEMFFISSIDSATIIKCFRQVFMRWGPPETLMTDNGRQFTSQSFSEFLSSFDVKHKTTCPYNPQCNGQSESFVKFVKNAISEKTFKSFTDFKEFLELLLFSFRCTPHSVTKQEPCSAMLGWQFRTGFPVWRDASCCHREIVQNIRKNQESWPKKKSKTKLKVGDRVKIKLPNGSYSTPVTLVQKLSAYSYLLSNGQKRNARKLAKI